MTRATAAGRESPGRVRMHTCPYSCVKFDLMYNKFSLGSVRYDVTWINPARNQNRIIMLVFIVFIEGV